MDAEWHTLFDELKRRVLEIDRKRWELDTRLADLLVLAVDAECNITWLRRRLRDQWRAEMNTKK